MLALAAAHEIQCRFTACVPVMAKGFNHAIQLAISAAAGAGRLFGLSVTNSQIRSDCDGRQHLPHVRARRTGFTMEGLLTRDHRDARCLRASLAKRGFTGPKGLFEGPYGLERCSPSRSLLTGKTLAGHRETDNHERNTARSFMASPCWKLSWI